MDDRIDPVEKSHPRVIDDGQFSGDDVGVVLGGDCVHQDQVVLIFPRRAKLATDVAAGAGDQDGPGTFVDRILVELTLIPRVVHVIVIQDG